MSNQNVTTDNTETIGGLGILCFLFPIIGLILFIVWKDSKPLKAKGAGKAALWCLSFHNMKETLGK